MSTYPRLDSQGLTTLLTRLAAVIKQGHSIVNSSGTELTQRKKLKFVGATIADDVAGNTTTVTVTGGGASSLDGLTDVDLTTPANNEVLKYNSTTQKWENGTGGAADIDDLTNVDISNVQDGEVLKYNSTTQKWENAEDSGDSAISELSDVVLTGLQGEQILKYNASTQKWVNTDIKTIQRDTLPTAGQSEEGNIYQYVGTTTSSYINGYFYQCQEFDGVYMWVNKPVQNKLEGYVPAYIVGNTPLADDWLSLTDEGEPLIPTEIEFYVVVSEGNYKERLYRWDTEESTYIEVSPSAEGASVMTGATENTDGESGLVPKPRAGDQNKVLFGGGTWGNLPVMVGASNVKAGEVGAVPKPEIMDKAKALFGDGQWHNIYSADAGSTVMVLTKETALYGRPVTLSDSRTSMTATMGNDGECYFTDVQMSGGVTVTCPDSEGNVARGSANLTYFGTYYVALTLNFATIHATTSDNDLLGQTIEIISNGSKIGESAFDANGEAYIYVDTLGTYTLKATGGDRHALRTVSVTALKQTYNVDMFLFYCYAFEIDENNSDPFTCVAPYESDFGCDNLGFTPAHMDYTTGEFDYGSWTGDEFFFPKPCMLKSTGVVDYYLDKDDYSLREDGVTPSDYNNRSYDGNCMIEFPTVYFSRRQSSGKTYCVISDKKLDATFHAYAHHDINGNVLPYIYLSAFDGSLISGKLRSIGGVNYHNRNAVTDGYILSNADRQTEINYAKANNSRTDCEGHNVGHKADWDMVNDLLILIGMSTDTQTTFGRGRDTGCVSATNTGIVPTGSMYNKGMFWGENAGAAGVKVFGIENWWGNIWKNCIGWINNHGTQLIKMTYGQEDGSTVDGYNLTGGGYVTVSGATPAGTSGGYINKWNYSDKGNVPYQASGSATTYTCDGLWFYNSLTDYALVGGYSDGGLRCGAFSAGVGSAAGDTGWNVGAALSYKDTI